MSSPNGTKDYTLEKERKHKECEINKTLCGSYSNVTGELPFIEAKELLRATIKYINRDHIEAFYNTANGNFIIVLTTDKLKRPYAHEINFREQVMNESLNFRIFPIPNPTRAHNHDVGKGSKHDPDTVFVTMYLPTTISNIAVKKVFMQFGEVHIVLTGHFKDDDLSGIRNGKRHAHLTPFKTKHDLPHKIQFPDDERFFNVMWGEKRISCKKCFSVHLLMDKCVDVQKYPVYQEDGYTIDTRPAYPDRIDENKDSEYILKSNVITKTVGTGYPESLGKASQIESSSQDSVNTCTHNKDVNIDQVASQIGKSDQDNGLETEGPESWEELHDEVAPVTEPDSHRPLERPPVLIAPTATMQPRLSLLAMLRLYQAVMMLWSFQTRMILQY